MKYTLLLLLGLSVVAAKHRDIDRGPFHTATIDTSWPRGNIAYKGLAVKLMQDGKVAGGICYDTDLLRMASAWTGGFLHLHKDVMSIRDFRQTQLDGELVGATRRAPGPAIGDPRSRPFGPLPAEIAKYRGLYVNGDDVVLHYTLGGAHVLERPAAEAGAITRTLQIDNPGPPILLRIGARPESPDRSREFRTDTDHTPFNGAWLSMGFSSRNDYLTRKRKEVKISIDGSAAPKLIDGNGGQYDLDQARVIVLTEPTTITVDLRSPQKIRAIETFSWHRDQFSAQTYTLSAAKTEGAWTELAQVDTSKHGSSGIHGVSTHAGGADIGEYRYLKFVFSSKTWLSEIDVRIDKDEPKFASLDAPIQVRVIGDAKLETTDSDYLLRIPKGESLTKIAMFTGQAAEFAKPEEVEPLTHGGSRRWNQTLTTVGKRGPDKGSYTRDEITMPEKNPWNAWFRPGGFDFFPDGKSAALCNVDGDVWTVSGLDDTLGELRWQRVATGLFQALGLTIRGNRIYVLGRDQITKLHDLNGDGETDFYENFNNDVETTWNFHEFAFDLQTDRVGNFYYAKGAAVRNGGRGFDVIAAHHGAIIQVAPNGKSSTVYAGGLRAPNGISVRADGQVTSGDNEGSWLPMCRLNLIEPGGFYGVVPTAHRKVPPTAYDPPICWLPKAVDNSGGGQVWVTSDKWGSFKGDLLHLSYGTCKLYHVMHETPGGVPQGGVWRIPVDLPSSAMRARFNRADGQLYICGLRGWQTSAAKDGHLSRIRYTGKETTMPRAMQVVPDGIAIAFTAPLDRDEATDPEAYAIKQWNYSWTEAYGSDDYSVVRPGEKGQDTVTVTGATLSADAHTVHLKFAIQKVDQMHIVVDLLDAKGKEVLFDIYNTVNVVP